MRPLSTAVKLTVRKASQSPEKLMSISKVNLSEKRIFIILYCHLCYMLLLFSLFIYILVFKIFPCKIVFIFILILAVAILFLKLILVQLVAKTTFLIFI